MSTNNQQNYQQQPQSSVSSPSQFSTIDGGSFVQCVCTDPKHTVLILGSKTKLFLSGAFSFQVLYGFVRVNGYLFSPRKYNTANFVKICVPAGHLPASFVIIDELSTELHIERIQSRLREFVNDPLKAATFIEANKPIAILLVKMEKDIASRFIQQQMTHFSPPMNIFPQIGKELGNNFYITNLAIGGRGRMSKEDVEALENRESEYLFACEQIYKFLAAQRRCIVFITGNKGVGKSTAARFIINALNAGPNSLEPKPTCRVFLLDTDVGQSELCPSGCISLCEMKRPLIGAPFTNPLTTLPKSYFFGSNSPAVDTELYTKLIVHLMENFHEIVGEQVCNEEENFVLIVNSLGWIEDLGYDLMIRVLGVVKPSFLLNLEMNDSLNFTVPPHYRKFTITTTKWENMPSAKPTAAKLRNFSMASYLAQLFAQKETLPSSFLRLAELPAYRVRFCSTSIYIHPELSYVDDKFMLCALNCSFVALCRIEDGFEKNFERKHLLGDSSLPARLELISENDHGESRDEQEIIPVERSVLPMLRCFGFGMIRAISPQRKLFYILTPVEQRVLTQVNVFAYGHCLNTPDMLLFDPNSQEPSPYVVELDDALQTHHKRFFSPLRVATIVKRGFAQK